MKNKPQPQRSEQVPESFTTACNDFVGQRTVDMETALNEQPPATDGPKYSITKEATRLMKKDQASQQDWTPDLFIGEKLVPYEQRIFHDEKIATDLGYKIIGRYVKLETANAALAAAWKDHLTANTNESKA